MVINKIKQALDSKIVERNAIIKLVKKQKI